MKKPQTQPTAQRLYQALAFLMSSTSFGLVTIAAILLLQGKIDLATFHAVTPFLPVSQRILHNGTKRDDK